MFLLLQSTLHTVLPVEYRKDHWHSANLKYGRASAFRLAHTMYVCVAPSPYTCTHSVYASSCLLAAFCQPSVVRVSTLTLAGDSEWKVMSLFQFGITRKHKAIPDREEGNEQVPLYFPDQSESGLGTAEYRELLNTVVDLTAHDGKEECTCARAKQGNYTEYKDTDCAKIGKYVSEHGNKLAHRKFVEDFPNLKKITVQNFKKRYLEELQPSRDSVCHQPHHKRKREASDFG